MSVDHIVDFLQNEIAHLRAEQEADHARLDKLVQDMNTFAADAKTKLEALGFITTKEKENGSN